MALPACRRPPLGPVLAALLVCCISMAGAAFTSPFVLAPVASMVRSPAPRLEIRDLMANKYSATLFIRSLAVMQNRPYTRLDSYAAMAAIHGSPNLYDNVDLGTDGRRGYCVHSMRNRNNHFFGPWHRPYLSMLEQALHEQAVALAAQYKTADRAQYVAAARRMRLLFWDTARAGGSVPTVLLRPTYVVTLPNGARSRVRNPLSTWTIPAAIVDYYQVEDGYETITRNADWTPSSSPTLEDISNLRINVLSMFQATTFACFTIGGRACTNTGSLEQIHNELHGTIGGSGHMSRLDIAAFDPIFFLHHCNVDRQMAIWEGINPDAKMDNIANNNAYPFRRPGTNTWWRTRDLMRTYSGQDSRAWGYYYPEFATPVTPQDLRNKVNDLYNDNKGQPVTVVTFVNANDAPVDGLSSISLATNVTTANNAASARRDVDPKSTRRTRRVEVKAGDVDLVTASSREGRFTVSKVNVDITDALQQLKDVNPNVKNVTIVATVTPTDDTAVDALPAKVNLGTPIVTTMIDGVVIATTANTTGPTILKVGDPTAAADVSLFQGVKNVTAPVVAGP